MTIWTSIKVLVTVSRKTRSSGWKRAPSINREFLWAEKMLVVSIIALKWTRAKWKLIRSNLCTSHILFTVTGLTLLSLKKRNTNCQEIGIKLRNKKATVAPIRSNIWQLAAWSKINCNAWCTFHCFFYHRPFIYLSFQRFSISRIKIKNH